MGLNGPREVLDHVWFQGLDWSKLHAKQVASPFIPPIEDNFDAEYTNDEWKDEDPTRQNSMMLRRNSVQQLFNGYYHDDKIDPVKEGSAGSKSKKNRESNDDFSSIPETSENSANSAAVAVK